MRDSIHFKGMLIAVWLVSVSMVWYPAVCTVVASDATEPYTSTIDQMITEEGVGGVPVTVEGEYYFIITMRNRIDPCSLEVVPDSGLTKVFVDADNYPVSEMGIARKIQVVDCVQGLQADELSKPELVKKIGDLGVARHRVATLMYADASVDAAIALVGLPKSIVDALKRLLKEGGKEAARSFFSAMERLKLRTADEYRNAQLAYSDILSALRRNGYSPVDECASAQTIYDRYLVAKHSEKIAHLLGESIWGKGEKDLAQIFGERLINDLSMGLTDEIIAEHIELDLIAASVAMPAISYKDARYSVALAESCARNSTTAVLNVPFKAQFPPGNWDKTRNCGQASVLMVLCYYQGKIPNADRIEEIDDWLNERYGDSINNYNGSFTDRHKLVTLAREYGGFPESYTANKWGLHNIIASIEEGHPVITAIAGKSIQLEYNKNGDWVAKSVDYNQGHWVVVTGYSGEHIICNDPGRRFGHNARYAKDVFLSAMYNEWATDDWKGAVVVTLPGKGDVESHSPTTTSGLATALVMDKSGSMRGDKLKCAQQASYVYVDTSAENEDMVSLVAFSNSAKSVTEPLTIAAGRETLKQNILSLSSGGSTNVGSGLTVALNHLTSSQLTGKTAVLLSDGRHNSGTYKPEVAEFVDRGWPISTVAFGKDADQEMLGWIAYQTGGNFFPAGLFDLSRVYHRINIQAHNGSVLRSYSDFIRAGKTLTYDVPVSFDMKKLGFFTNWQGSSMETTLITPSGERIHKNNVKKWGRYIEGNNHTFFEIDEPVEGQWKARIVGHALPHKGEQVNFHCSYESNIYSNILGFQPQYSRRKAVRVGVKLAEVGDNGLSSMKRAKVTAEIKKPSSRLKRLATRRTSRNKKEWSIDAKDLVEIIKEIASLTTKVTLYDDGRHEDMQAGDGIYANTYEDATTNGPYLVTINIEAQPSQGNSIKRKLQESFQVGPIERNSFTISELLDLLTNKKHGRYIPTDLPEKIKFPEAKRVLDSVLKDIFKKD